METPGGHQPPKVLKLVLPSNSTTSSTAVVSEGTRKGTCASDSVSELLTPTAGVSVEERMSSLPVASSPVPGSVTGSSMFVFEEQHNPLLTPVRAARLLSSSSNTTPLLSAIQALETSNRTMAREIEKLRRSNEALNKKLVGMLEGEKTHQKLTEKLLYIVSRRRENYSKNQQQFEDQQATGNGIERISNSQYELSDEQILSTKNDSCGAGNFAARLVSKLFPELFGLDWLRLKYNWYGGGALRKLELGHHHISA